MHGDGGVDVGSGSAGCCGGGGGGIGVVLVGWS